MPTKQDWQGQDTWEASVDNGLRSQFYANRGWDGDAGTRGRVKIAVIDLSFDPTHPIFKSAAFGSCPGTGCRIRTLINCEIQGCRVVSSFPDTGPHGTYVAAIAAGDLTRGQDSKISSAVDRRRYSGASYRSELILVRGGANARAIQAAVAAGADVIVAPLSADWRPCNGTNGAGVVDAAFAAEQQGVPVIFSAGNPEDTIGCSMSSVAQAPATLAVGGVGNEWNACSSFKLSPSGIPLETRYRDCDVYHDGGDGPVAYVVDGQVRSGSGLDVLAPACMDYLVRDRGSYQIRVTPACGTSLAAPHVAGALANIKTALIEKFGWVTVPPGALHVLALGMTDRAKGVGKYNLTGFDPIWGGGRFQPRDLENENWEIVVTPPLKKNEIFDVPWFGTGAEPTTVTFAKVYAKWFDTDPLNASDIDVWMLKNNCNVPAPWGPNGDVSYDLKAMVAARGADVSGQQLCTRVVAKHIPAGQTRSVVLFHYGSNTTVMR